MTVVLVPGSRRAQVRERRVAAALALYRAGRAGRLLLSGGVTSDTRPEAWVMAERLRARRVPESAIWVEPRARSTWENAREAAEILGALGVDRIWLVSDAWHLPRLAWSVRAHGLVVVGETPVLPASAGQRLTDCWMVLREGVARLWYRLRHRRIPQGKP